MMCMKRLVTTRYSINISKKGLPGESLRLAFLTDMHDCCSDEETRAIFRILEEEQPAAVLVGGDMIFAKPGWSVEGPRWFMQELAARYPVWCGTGNHEYRTRLYPEEYGSMYADYVGAIREAGVHVLENASDRPEISGVPLQITGFDMDRHYYRRFRRTEKIPAEELQAAIGVPDADRFTILLAHDPSQMDAYFAWGADLALCGHTHGGMVRFGKHTGLISPNFAPFPGYAYGRFDRGEQTIIVSSGLGEHHIPLRINNPREVVILTCRIQKAAAQQTI